MERFDNNDIRLRDDDDATKLPYGITLLPIPLPPVVLLPLPLPLPLLLVLMLAFAALALALVLLFGNACGDDDDRSTAF
jgi:hypothetical protein